MLATRRAGRSLGLFLVALALSAGASAAQTDITGPAGSASFGKHVAVLPNGNIVVTDPAGVTSQVGAAYLYDPNGNLLDSISGGQANDHVGSGGILVLKSGNFLILSPDWNNGSASRAGAITFGNAASGFAGGVVSPANSLVGSSTDDAIGFISGSLNVIALANGNYVVGSYFWDNLAAGASNAGAATWGSGTSGVTGPITAANSLVGSHADDGVSLYYVRELANGHYVVNSPGWHDASNAGVGAVTWGNGNGGTVGAISAANSLVGSTQNDNVGNGYVTPLRNGHYVVATQCWQNGAIACAGAVTWCNGNGGTVGPVSATNSLVGDHYDDRIGNSYILPLGNGNYVVGSGQWDNGATTDAGAATWGNGSGGTVGAISAANSLVGTKANDKVGWFGLSALSNGNYVVTTSAWHNAGNAAVGAITWGDGASGTSGPVSAANSLLGSTADDFSNARILALGDGNYVVTAPYWDNGGIANAGAATWRPGNAASTTPISAANALVGSTANDHVGGFSPIALANGHYVIQSPDWDNGGTVDAGAVTWANGNGGTVGAVSPANSLVGGTVGDAVGSGLIALSNGHYVATSPLWNNGATGDAGALSWGRGSGGLAGAVSTANSLAGNHVSDKLGLNGAVAVAGANYVVRSAWFDSMTFSYIGAIGLVRGFGAASHPGMAEFVAGGVDTGFATAGFAYDAARDVLVVGRPGLNKVTILKLDLLFRDGFEP